MARKTRQKAVSGIYHVMIRGINKQNIFLDDDDYITMMRVLAEAHLRKSPLGDIIKRNECRILAYAIMPNHVHILIKEEDETLSNLLKKIEDRYVYLYNVKYERCGHLFQDRFRSEPVDKKEYFKMLLRYIHRNPVKGMLCKRPEDYSYSSWREYVNCGQSPIVRVCDTGLVMNTFTQDELTEWVNQNVDDDCMDMDKERFVLTDKHAWEIIADLSGAESAEDFKQYPHDIQMKYIRVAIAKGVSIRQASRLSILSYYKIQKEMTPSMRNSNRGVRPLDWVFALIKEDNCMRLSTISEKTGISVYGCRKLLQALESQGLIQQIGTGRSWEWEVLSD